MWYFKQWVENRKVKKDLELKIAREGLEAKKELKELEQRDLVKEMLSKKCPINNNKNCDKGCVNFHEGRVIKWWHFDKTYSFEVVFPKCKLWND